MEFEQRKEGWNARPSSREKKPRRICIGAVPLQLDGFNRRAKTRFSRRSGKAEQRLG
jgi:hypothetical protein